MNIRGVIRTILNLCVVAALMTSCSRSPVERGAACLSLGDYAMAIQFFGEALKRNPDRYDARLGMGKALLQRAADNLGDTASWRDACMNLEAARTLNPSIDISGVLAQAWSERARHLLDKNDTLAALSALTRAIGYDPQRIEPLNAAGIIYFRMGQLEKSNALFISAYTIDSMNTAVRFNMGMVAWNKGNIAGAREHWLFCLKQSPGDESALYWFARAEKQFRDSVMRPAHGRRSR
jgi:tetratricopeptide (TPR) repeat protein